VRRYRSVAHGAVLLLAIAGCGGGVEPSALDATPSSIGTATSEGQTLDEESPQAAVDRQFGDLSAATAAAAATPPSESTLGSSDFAAAATIGTALFSQLDSTGVELFVFPVIGTSDVLLVMEIDGAAINTEAEPTDLDLLVFLASDPSVGDAGITRFVANFHAVDDQGAVVITTTIPLPAIVEAVANGTDIADDAVIFQVTRNGVAQ
jgi:hypothetical protein